MVKRFVAALAVCAYALVPANAQVKAPDSISPVYEGWQQNEDGSYTLLFGYFNRNWEEVDVPIGPNNKIEPGNADQGQPTHFYPRRTRYRFSIKVPKDFGTKEVVWTLTVNGRTEKAYATLKPDYFTDNMIIQANNGEGSVQGGENNNKAPSLTIEGESARTAKVGVPVTLTVVAIDDGIPKPRPGPPSPIPARVKIVPTAAAGLRFSWFVYRGAGQVTFDPPQFKSWEDERDGHDAPQSPGWVTPPVPAGNKWVVKATFTEPGSYVLRGLAHDGGLFDQKDVQIVVTR
jgi:hypothetical protein